MGILTAVQTTSQQKRKTPIFAIYRRTNGESSTKAFPKPTKAEKRLEISSSRESSSSSVRCGFFGLNSEYDATGEWFVFVHYLSKYMDWFDTLWITLKKNRKQMSFLHVYHHATISMVWGFLLYKGVGSGTVRYGAWINSLTHVIMYSHYLWTSFGLKNPFKKYITGWQISQFYSCLLHAILVQCVETTESQKMAWLQLGYQSTMVYLFTLKLNWVPKFFPQFGMEDKSKEQKKSK